MSGGLLACGHLAQLHTQRIHNRGLVQRARLWATQGLALRHTASIHFFFLIFNFAISFNGSGKDLHLGKQQVIFFCIFNLVQRARLCAHTVGTDDKLAFAFIQQALIV